MVKLKSGGHHWWPEGLSQFWKNDEGQTNWIMPDGQVKTMPPKNLGVIGNGHHIKLGEAGEETVWDHSFEAEFQEADDNFPAVVKWLEKLNPTADTSALPVRERFQHLEVEDDKLSVLMKGLVSLAIRSPMNREAAVSLAEHYRGPLPQQERNRLIGLNMRNSYTDAVEHLGIKGKFVVIYSPSKEFVFADGFYHNIRSPFNSVISPTILVALTPRLSVLFTRPMSYTTLPRLFTLKITEVEALNINRTTAIYSRNKLFYRSEKPEIEDAYQQGEHLVYDGHRNPIQKLIDSIPGIPPRGTSLDFLFQRRKK